MRLAAGKARPPPLLAVGADLIDFDPQHTCPQASQAARRNQAAKASASRARMRIQGDEFDARFGYAPSVTGHARASKPTARRCHHPLLTHYRHDARRYPRFEEGPPRVGWLLDMSPTTVPDEEGKERSGLDLYFLQQDGDTFKVRRAHRQIGCWVLDKSANTQSIHPDPIPNLLRTPTPMAHARTHARTPAGDVVLRALLLPGPARRPLHRGGDAAPAAQVRLRRCVLVSWMVVVGGWFGVLCVCFNAVDHKQTNKQTNKPKMTGMTIVPCDKEDLDMPNHLSGK